jgi:hypothetical protein
MTVKELIYDSGIDIQSEYVIKHWDEELNDCIVINEDDALYMTIESLYHTNEQIVIEV